MELSRIVGELSQSSYFEEGGFHPQYGSSPGETYISSQLYYETRSLLLSIAPFALRYCALHGQISFLTRYFHEIRSFAEM